ncbi:MAG: trypsin-like serine protease [Nannocystaceae bacterium]|nr:trypsin-like serine protease [Nannocystaceae bacterium]
MRISTAALISLTAFVFSPSYAHAIITRHDVDDADYIVDGAAYPELVNLFEPGDCLATLVHPSYLLTVAHCAADLEPGASLSIGSETRAVTTITLHPRWNDADAFDIALIRLDTPVLSVQPIPLNRAEDELGSEIELLGRGLHGTGEEGESGATDDAQLRRATNTVDSVDDHFLRVTFDPPTRETSTVLEGVGAGGDSGGPVFLRREGITYLAGLNAWGDSCDVDVARYTANDYQLRVSQYVAWIDAGIAGRDSQEGPSGGSRFANAECSSCSVGGERSGFGLLLLLALGWRRRRG